MYSTRLLLTANSFPKNCHFQAPQRMSLGVWESQKTFCKNFPKTHMKPHFYVQLTIFRTPAAGTHQRYSSQLPPSISLKAKKILAFFSSKRPFFFYRKKGRRVNCPLIFPKVWSEGGVVDWNIADKTFTRLISAIETRENRPG